MESFTADFFAIFYRKASKFGFWANENFKNMSKSACRLPQIAFCRGVLKNKKGPGTCFFYNSLIKNYIL